jgi:hypothetical protein
MTKNELLKLADRVEAGEADPFDVLDGLYPSLEAKACPAYNDIRCGAIAFLTHLDAAKSLHDAVCHTWWWEVTGGQGDPDEGPQWYSASVSDAKPVDSTQTFGEASNPAAAWVAAILRAKAEELK